MDMEQEANSKQVKEIINNRFIGQTLPYGILEVATIELYLWTRIRDAPSPPLLCIAT
jgi:hypothetical protein